MTSHNRYFDKQIVGTIANTLSLGVLIFFLRIFVKYSEEFSKQSIPALLIVAIFLLVPALLIVISTRFLQNNSVQTKANVAGKSISLFFTIMLLVFAVNNNFHITNIEEVISLLMFIGNALWTPWSFYVLSRNSVDVIMEQKSEQQINPEDMKLPPGVWK